MTNKVPLPSFSGGGREGVLGVRDGLHDVREGVLDVREGVLDVRETSMDLFLFFGIFPKHCGYDSNTIFLSFFFYFSNVFFKDEILFFLF
jgi:hypothetical protein